MPVIVEISDAQFGGEARHSRRCGLCEAASAVSGEQNRLAARASARNYQIKLAIFSDRKM